MTVLEEGQKLRSLRIKLGVSQAKLSKISGINQHQISAYELGKNGLNSEALSKVHKALDDLDHNAIQKLKIKKYRKHIRNGNTITSRPRRHYSITPGNFEYIEALNELAEEHSKQSIVPENAPKVMSLFSGCGGLSYGIKAAGFNIVGASEINIGFRDIYEKNSPNVHNLSSDIRKITKSECNHILAKEGQIDLIAGGPPCQGFSLAGKRNPDDERNTLFYDYLRIAEYIRPKVILMENVRLLTSMKNSDGRLVTDCIMDAFSDIGYTAKFYCINAKEYGVPQHRERVIFIATNYDLGKLPTKPPATHGQTSDLFSNVKPFRSFGDAVSDLEFIESGEKSITDEWHFAVSHPEHVIEWLIDVPQGCSAHENLDPKLRPPSGYNTTYKRQVWNEPGATVATTFAMISGCRNVHPIATRSLTVREAMRLQSFPDSFQLCGKLGDIRSSIGNAVPPLLAYILANHILADYIL